MTLSQRSFNLAIAILISLIAFKLLTPLVLPFTWNPIIRSVQTNHLPLPIQLIAFFISCGLELTTPLIVGWRNSQHFNSSTTFSTSPISKNLSPPLWAILSYLLLLISQILLSINYIYTNSISLTSLPPTVAHQTSLDSKKLGKIELGGVISYGVLVLGAAIFGVCRRDGVMGKKRGGNREGEIQLMEREEVRDHDEEERFREDEFEEHDLGERVKIQDHPGKL